MIRKRYRAGRFDRLRIHGLLCGCWFLSCFLIGSSANNAVLAREAEAKAREAPAGKYSDWQYQADKKRYFCRYDYLNRAGSSSFQFVLFYPDDERGKVYYFQTPGGSIWACCTRPGAANYAADTMKWYRPADAAKKETGAWVRQADGECPAPPDGGRPIASPGNAPLPVPPPPESFAQLSGETRQLAVALHKLLAEITVTDRKIVAIDLSSADIKDDALAQLAKISTLERLYLSGTAVTDRGLAQLAGLTKLSHLDLSQTQISDSGLKAIQDLPALRTLIVRGSERISPAGVRLARKSNAKLLITGP